MPNALGTRLFRRCLWLPLIATASSAAEPVAVAHWRFDDDRPEAGQAEGGVVPSAAEIEAFLAEESHCGASAPLTACCKTPRWADHWTAYWQDVLTENPNILRPSLNNSGPFRFWIHEALSDNLPADRFVTKLVRMEGGILPAAPVPPLPKIPAEKALHIGGPLPAAKPDK